MPKYNAFVQLSTVRLYLEDNNEDGPWIEVKAEIGMRDQKRIESALLRGAQQVSAEGAETVELKLDGAEVALVKLKTYLVAWSFTDPNDKPVRVTADAIATLRPAVADLILAKLNAYLDEVAEERASDPFRNASTPRSA
jgi:hypothetical protein